MEPDEPDPDVRPAVILDRAAQHQARQRLELARDPHPRLAPLAVLGEGEVAGERETGPEPVRGGGVERERPHAHAERVGAGAPIGLEQGLEQVIERAAEREPGGGTRQQPQLVVGAHLVAQPAHQPAGREPDAQRPGVSAREAEPIGLRQVLDARGAQAEAPGRAQHLVDLAPGLLAGPREQELGRVAQPHGRGVEERSARAVGGRHTLVAVDQIRLRRGERHRLRARRRGEQDQQHREPPHCDAVTPVRGHSGASTHAEQRGLRAWQVSRPWRMSQCENRIQRSRGITSISACSILTASRW